MNRSLQFRLSLGLSFAVTVVALVTGIFAFAAARDEALELQDDVLRQIAGLFDHNHLPSPQPVEAQERWRSDEHAQVIVQVLSLPTIRDGVEAPRSHPFTASLRNGMQTVGVDEGEYRVFVRKLDSGERIAVAQETAVRDEAALESALLTVAPLPILAVILVLVVAVLVRQTFKPIGALAAEIDQHDENRFQPVPTIAVPTEVRPFVAAINRLLGRVEQAMVAQQRFVADAAHELRSPITALSLQAERLANAEMSNAARERLGTLREGIERTRGLLEQLLSLARAQVTTAVPQGEISLREIIRRVLEDLMPLAIAKSIDVGVIGAGEVSICASEIDAISIVKNVLDNAIRYTACGGRVDLQISRSARDAFVTVEDNGPGIPLHDRDRVFDPFHRLPGNDATGSGLGLAIAHTVTRRLGGKIELADSDKFPHGLKVTVQFPLPAEGSGQYSRPVKLGTSDC